MPPATRKQNTASKENTAPAGHSSMLTPAPSTRKRGRQPDVESPIDQDTPTAIPARGRALGSSATLPMLGSPMQTSDSVDRYALGSIVGDHARLADRVSQHMLAYEATIALVGKGPLYLDPIASTERPCNIADIIRDLQQRTTALERQQAATNAALDEATDNLQAAQIQLEVFQAQITNLEAGTTSSSQESTAPAVPPEAMKTIRVCRHTIGCAPVQALTPLRRHSHSLPRASAPSHCAPPTPNVPCQQPTPHSSQSPMRPPSVNSWPLRSTFCVAGMTKSTRTPSLTCFESLGSGGRYV